MDDSEVAAKQLEKKNLCFFFVLGIVVVFTHQVGSEGLTLEDDKGILQLRPDQNPHESLMIKDH